MLMIRGLKMSQSDVLFPASARKSTLVFETLQLII